jgi:hypothetical protein
MAGGDLAADQADPSGAADGEPDELRCELGARGVPRWLAVGHSRADPVAFVQRTLYGVAVVFTMWRAVLARRGTPPAILDKLETAFKTLSEDQSFRALIKSLGDEVRFHGGKEFEKTWRDEWEQHARIVAHAK